MKGHERLIDLRRRGQRPSGGVLVDASPRGDKWALDWARQGLSFAVVDIAPTDSLHDLRFATGLEVDVFGDDERRVGQVAMAFVQAGASRVVAGSGNGRGETFERFAFGNEEVMAWPM